MNCLQQSVHVLPLLGVRWRSKLNRRLSVPLQNPPEVSLVDRNQKIQAFAPKRTDEAFAKCIRLRCAHRCLQYTNTKVSERKVEQFGEDRVTVVKHKANACGSARISRNCWVVHSAVGWSVTLQCRIRREPTSIATKTWRMRNDAVTLTKKSHATIAWAWFRMNVAQR
jgi:hypothetical protein